MAKVLPQSKFTSPHPEPKKGRKGMNKMSPTGCGKTGEGCGEEKVMEAKHEHITEQIGASYDTDYKVITRCSPNCPACAFKAGYETGLKEAGDWMRKQQSFLFSSIEVDDAIAAFRRGEMPGETEE